ncbi:MAG: hypothetical protein L3J18_00740 [Candidatus Brocadia sp.]|jgi:Glycosyltransferase|uniref:Glycosyltransferase n=1 Tax=Candidatus Brocadia fulgida TaxID=380242 RepID=A0A0M2UWC5_9BACT|nr:MAG: hypothetical protein BROFUL_00894 [Candidatus Brocadia fulgida]UJS20884.1 MAG: hypothetical protein L3J18_00740 [Candidatus Brocadia sp.]
MSTQIKRIAFFVHYMHPLKISPSIVNSAIMWAKSGYEVDIYKCESGNEGVNIPNVNIIYVSKSIPTLNPLKRISTVFSFIRNSYKYCKGRNYIRLIGFDPYGLIIAGALGIILRLPIVYYSLEVLTPAVYRLQAKFKVLHWLHYIVLKKLERFFHRRSELTVIQDKQRAELLYTTNAFSINNSVLFVPNSPLRDNGDYIKPRSNYLRVKYSIDMNSKIILYAGQISEAIGIRDLIQYTHLWPDGCVFVIHGFGPKDYIQKIISLKNQFPKVILSQDLLDENEYNTMIRSADIGIIWRIDKKNQNSFIMGAASGKMFYYLKSELPIISNKLPGLAELIEDTQCGICVDEETQVGDAILRLLNNFSFYQKNTTLCFKKYEFSKHYQKVIDIIERSSK